MNTQQSRVQIVGTIGPSCATPAIIEEMIQKGLDIVRLNFSWGTYDEHRGYIQAVRALEMKLGKHIPLFIDLPGPRIQHEVGHSYDKEMIQAITEEDKKHIAFGVAEGVDYFGVSFVGSASDITIARDAITAAGGSQPIIAKIERQVAVDTHAEIIAAADAIMIARGDLGEEIPLEKIPFIEVELLEACNKAQKPVITATQMLLSMTKNPFPTRAEVTDVAFAVIHGTDAIMLSDETAMGSYPVEAVAMMERIALEAEQHARPAFVLHPFTRQS